MADLSTIPAIRREFPKLKALATKPFCGENGIRRFIGRIEEILAGSLPLSTTLRNQLERTADELRSKLSEDTKKVLEQKISRVEEKSDILAELAPGETREIPSDDKGSKVSLLDTCAQLNNFFNRKQYGEMAREIQVIFAHIDQGWLGETQRKFAVRFLSEIKSSLQRIADQDVRKATRGRLTQAIKALESE